LPLHVVCSFCGNPVEPGTGLMFVRNDNQRSYFCSRKCEHSLVRMDRKARKLKWTAHYEKGPSPPQPEKAKVPDAEGEAKPEGEKKRQKKAAEPEGPAPSEDKPTEAQGEPGGGKAGEGQAKPEAG